MSEKTLYDVLGVAKDATFEEIRAAYEALRQRCEVNAAGLCEEDKRIKLLALSQAYETLSDNVMRALYDAKLAGRPIPAAWVGVLEGGATPAARRRGMMEALNDVKWLSTGIWTLLGVVGIWLTMQIVNSILISRYLSENRSFPPADAAAQERAIIQDYYQETGIRAASKAEVEMLQAADRRAAEEKRQLEAAQKDKEKAEREYRRFVEDGRRLGNDVSSTLRQEELRQQHADERARQEAEWKKQREEQAEADRLERERNRWRTVVRGGGSQGGSGVESE